MRLRLLNFAAPPGLIQKKFRPNSIPQKSALWIYQPAQQRSVAVPTGGIGSLAADRARAKLPACVG